MTSFEQDHNSVVNGDAYEVAHAHAKATGGRQTVRRSGTTLPNGDALSYSYSASGGAFDDALSRGSGISHGATSVARYAYDGAGFVSRTTLPTISMVNGTTTPTLGTWVGIDRHNRPIEWKWHWAGNSGVTAYHEGLTWDRANNVTWREDHVHSGFDVVYDIDELNRVTRAEEGTMPGVNGTGVMALKTIRVLRRTALSRWRLRSGGALAVRPGAVRSPSK